MASSPPSKDAAVKSRIISHMNEDHSPSLSRYLEHYCSLPNPSSPRLEELTLSYIIISSNGGYNRNLIPFDPPMRSYAETRDRVVAMDKASLEGLNRSDIEVTSYEPPKGWMAAWFLFCVIVMIVFCRSRNLQEGSIMHLTALKYLPSGFLRFGHAVQPFVFYPMLAIHVGEAHWMAAKRLSRHNVRFMERLWWVWVLSTFVEGFPAFFRFDAVVKREQERLERRKSETKNKGRETMDAINALQNGRTV